MVYDTVRNRQSGQSLVLGQLSPYYGRAAPYLVHEQSTFPPTYYCADPSFALDMCVSQVFELR